MTLLKVSPNTVVAVALMKGPLVVVLRWVLERIATHDFFCTVRLLDTNYYFFSGEEQGGKKGDCAQRERVDS